MQQAELKKILAEIREFPNQILDPQTFINLISNLDAELLTQSRQEIFDTVCQIKEEDLRAQSLLAILPCLDNQLKGQLLKSLGEITDQTLHDDTLERVVRDLAADDLIELALSAASEIKDQKNHDFAVIHIVKIIQERDSSWEAIQITNFIKNEITRLEVLTSLARRLNDMELTMQVLAQADDLARKALDGKNYNIKQHRLPDLIEQIRNHMEKLTSRGRSKPSDTPANSADDPPLEPAEDIKEEVFFTAFHPKEGSVEIWHTLLVYTHIESVIAQVRDDAKRFEDQSGPPKETTNKSLRRLKRGTQLTMIPNCDAVVFNPERVSFKWLEDFHRADFRFKADKSLSGDAAKGSVDIYAGPLIIGTLKFAMLFNDGETQPAPDHEEHAKMYGKDDIFISYSRRDTEVARTFKTVLQGTGFDVFLDVDDIRSGQLWEKELKQRIEQSKIFQIFWSANYSQSENCKAEWEYALKQNKEEGFIRPVFWRKPLSPNPPEELNKFNFKYVELKLPNAQ